MKKLISLLMTAILILQHYPSAWAIPATDVLRISRMDGAVQVCQSGTCEPGQVGQVLSVGQSVQVSAGGKAILSFGKDTYEIRERSRVLVDQITPKSSRLNMFVGTLKARIAASWFGRRNVAVVTPAGVMAVRGTEFMVNVGDGGNTRIDVLYGSVDFVNAATGRRETSFIQGESGQIKGVRPQGQQQAGRGEAQPSDQQVAKPDEEKGEEKKEEAKEEKSETQTEEAKGEDQDAGADQAAGPMSEPEVEKGELSNESFVEAFGGADGFQVYSDARESTNERADSFASNEAAQVADVVTTVREDGLASGRTLRDVHGNLVRVEQLFQRPTADQLKFVNLVKRDSYVYSGYFTPTTSVPSARKDFAEFTIAFNKSLPENVGDWPTFFTDNEKTLKVSNMTMKLANNTDTTAQDYIKFEAAYNSAKDEVGGVVCAAGQTLGSGCFEKTTLGFVNGSSQGEWLLTDCTLSNCNTTTKVEKGGGEPPKGDDSGNLWATIETPFNAEQVTDSLNLITEASGAAAPEMWLLVESYALDNSGTILNIDNILNGNITDPFTFLKTVSAQTIITARTAKSSATGSTIFRRGNIDLVIIPDLMVDLVQKYAITLADSF